MGENQLIIMYCNLLFFIVNNKRLTKLFSKLDVFTQNKLEPHSSLPNTLLANLPIRLFISPVKILSG